MKALLAFVLLGLVSCLLAAPGVPPGENGRGIPRSGTPARQVRVVYDVKGRRLCLTTRADGNVAALRTADGLQIESCVVAGGEAKPVVIETRAEDGWVAQRKLKLAPGKTGDVGHGIAVRCAVRDMPGKATGKEIARIRVAAVERSPKKGAELPAPIARFVADSLRLPQVSASAELTRTPPWDEQAPGAFPAGELFVQVREGTVAGSLEVAVAWKPGGKASVTASVALWAGGPPAVFGPLDRRSGMALAIWAE